jgi:hypothetical protein
MTFPDIILFWDQIHTSPFQAHKQKPKHEKHQSLVILLSPLAEEFLDNHLHNEQQTLCLKQSSG